MDQLSASLTCLSEKKFLALSMPRRKFIANHKKSA